MPECISEASIFSRRRPLQNTKGKTGLQKSKLAWTKAHHISMDKNATNKHGYKSDFAVSRGWKGENMVY